jgi:hypothetical protein
LQRLLAKPKQFPWSSLFTFLNITKLKMNRIIFKILSWFFPNTDLSNSLTFSQSQSCATVPLSIVLTFTLTAHKIWNLCSLLFFVFFSHSELTMRLALKMKSPPKIRVQFFSGCWTQPRSSADFHTFPIMEPVKLDYIPARLLPQLCRL